MHRFVLYSLLFIMPHFVLGGCKQKNNNTNLPLIKDSITVQSDKIQKSLKNDENIIFTNATISGIIDFTQANAAMNENLNLERVYVSSGISFSNCTFENKVTAHALANKINTFCHFDKNVTFINCTFKEDVVFTESIFNGIVAFNNCIFEKKAIFEGALFEYKNIYFTECEFKDEGRFQRTVYRGEVNFIKAKFNKAVFFQNARFFDVAQFGACRFYQYADFSNITAYSAMMFHFIETSELREITFNNSSFKGKVEFVDTKFKGNTDFSACDFLGMVKFNNSKIFKTFNLEKSRFHSGKPLTENMVKEKEANIILKDSYIFSPQLLENKDF